MFVAFAANIIDGRELLVVVERLWESAVSIMGGAVKVGNGCIKGRPWVSRLVTVV